MWRALGWLHRWGGLVLAAPLAICALTGSLLALRPELSAAFGLGAPQDAPACAAAPLDPFTLRERFLASEPRADLEALPLQVKPGRAFELSLFPREDPATGKPYELGFRAAHLDPCTGEVLHHAAAHGHMGGPLWPIGRHNLFNVIWAIHVRLLLPSRIGAWVLGLTGLLWTLDCFAGLTLTFPRRSAAGPGARAVAPVWLVRWWTAWRPTFRGKAYRINHRLHTAGGLWPWLLLFVLAWSSVGFLLRGEVYQPVMHALFGHRPLLEEMYSLPPLPGPRSQPKLGWREAAAVGARLVAERAAVEGFEPGPALNLQYDPDSGLYLYDLSSSRSLSADGLGTILCFDGDTGAWWRTFHLTGQDPGTTTTVWFLFLHSGQVWGMPYRLLLATTGLVVTMLSVTGVWLWWKKRSFRASPRPRPDPT